MQKKENALIGLFVIMNCLKNNLYIDKRSKSILSLILVFGFILLFTIYIVSSDNLNLRINGTTGGYASNVRLKTNPNSTLGYDTYDLEAPPDPGNLSVFYTVISGYNLVIDSWNTTSNPRTINLSYLLPVTQTGIINFSWSSLIGSGLSGLFIYHGTNSLYSPGGNITNLRTNSGYNNTLSSNSQVYMQVNISDNLLLTVNINSTDGSNKTLQNLNCFATLIDPDPGHKMNVTVYWYKNNQSTLLVTYNTSYDNATFFNGVLHNLNTTRGENWSCGIQTFDSVEFSTKVNSSNLLILNSIPNATLISPANNTRFTDRKPTFNWTGADDDSDSLTYEINISLVAKSTCYEANRYVSGITNLNYTVATYLRCLSDNNDYYIWNVRSYDGTNYSSWSVNGTFNFSIQSNISISLPTPSINFGNKNPGDIDNTTDNSPAPIVISNDGNVELNITANFSDLWVNVQNNTKYYQYKARNLSADCFNYASSTTSFANASTLTRNIINKLNFSGGYQTACNNASFDVNIEVPAQEPYGAKSSLVVLSSQLAEFYPAA